MVSLILSLISFSMELSSEELFMLLGDKIEAYEFRLINNKDKSNRDSLLDIIKITGLSNGELESLIINRTKRPRIPIITIHQAKGLEYENVFLAGAQKNTFPSFRALNSNNLEEEKRLFYVAITRAKKRLFISCNTSGYFGYNDKSPFINHIPSKYITSVKE